MAAMAAQPAAATAITPMETAPAAMAAPRRTMTAWLVMAKFLWGRFVGIDTGEFAPRRERVTAAGEPAGRVP